MSSETLALKWRPKSFDEVVGQRFTAGSLARMVEKETVPTALLFSGPPGSGKTTVARILAEALEAADIIEIDAAANGSVDQLRTVLSSLRYATGGKHRVVIFDEAHSISDKGFETLLKTLEEPPELTIFVLVTTERHRIPKTIHSRLVEFNFRAVTAGDVALRLAHIATTEKIAIERALVIHLANRANGDVRGAIQDMDLAARAGIQTLREYVDLVGDGDPAPTLFAALMEGNHAKIFAVVEDQLQRLGDPGFISAELCHLITDLFSIKAGGKLPEGQRFEIRKQLASRVDHERLLLSVRMLWDLRTKIRGSADPRASLDMALILISEVLSRANPARFAPPTVESPQPAAAPASRKMSLAEMQRD